MLLRKKLQLKIALGKSWVALTQTTKTGFAEPCAGSVLIQWSNKVCARSSCRFGRRLRGRDRRYSCVSVLLSDKINSTHIEMSLLLVVLAVYIIRTRRESMTPTMQGHRAAYILKHIRESHCRYWIVWLRFASMGICRAVYSSSRPLK